MLRFLAMVLVAVMPAFFCPPARGGVIEVVVESKTILNDPILPVDGFVDVFLKVTGGAVPDLAAWQAAVDLQTAAAGLVFTSPFAQPAAESHPAVIAENFMPNFTGDGGPHRASAMAYLNSGAAQINDGDGLFRVPFRVDPGVVGAFTVTIDPDPFTGSVLSDANFGAIPFTAVSGTISVNDVPEPASLSALIIAALTLAVRRRRSVPAGDAA